MSPSPASLHENVQAKAIMSDRPLQVRLHGLQELHKALLDVLEYAHSKGLPEYDQLHRYSNTCKLRSGTSPIDTEQLFYHTEKKSIDRLAADHTAALRGGVRSLAKQVDSIADLVLSDLLYARFESSCNVCEASDNGDAKTVEDEFKRLGYLTRRMIHNRTFIEHAVVTSDDQEDVADT